MRAPGAIRQARMRRNEMLDRANELRELADRKQEVHLCLEQNDRVIQATKEHIEEIVHAQTHVYTEDRAAMLNTLQLQLMQKRSENTQYWGELQGIANRINAVHNETHRMDRTMGHGMYYHGYGMYAQGQAPLHAGQGFNW